MPPTMVMNKETGIMIGWCHFKGKPSLYVQRGLERQYLAQFTGYKVANLFMETLLEYDEGGGNDEEYH